MFRCVQNVMDSESLQMCRLCLVREDLVYIFNPKGCHGFRLWEIIEELLKEEVSKEDGLPWTVCKGCVGKLKDFKQFKMTCVRAKTSILTMIANRDVVSNIKKEEVEADELLTGGEICSQHILCLDESACTGVSNDSSLANPLDLRDMKEEADSSKSLLDAETFNHDNEQHSENLAIPVSNVVCLPIEFGDQCFYEEEDHASISVTMEEGHGRKNFGIDGSSFASVSNITSLQQSVGIMVNVKEEIAPSISTPEAETTIVEKFLRDESSDEETLNNESSPLEMEDLVRAVNVTGGFTKTSENIVCISRREREENTSKQLKKNARPSRVSPGEHSLRNNSNLPSVNARHQAEKYLSAKESERDTCKKGFAQKGELVKHSSEPSGLRPFQCGTCERGFTQKRDLVRHSIVHSGVRPFTCDICEKKFKWKTALTNHSVIHSGIRAYNCDECGKSFTRKSDLTRHAGVHSGLERFKCEKCGKTFTQNGDLRRHSAIHSGFKPFKCDTCGKRFSQKGNLGMHLAIHSGFKPFKCDTCLKRFTHKSALRIHSLVHSSCRPFKCDTCGKQFKLKQYLVRHTITHNE